MKNLGDLREELAVCKHQLDQADTQLNYAIEDNRILSAELKAARKIMKEYGWHKKYNLESNQVFCEILDDLQRRH